MARYSVNKVILIGLLGRDPDSRYTSDGTPVANFSMATTRPKRAPNGDWANETEWHRVVAWERHAELAMEHLHKGSKVYVEGRIQSRRYTDNQNIERTSFEIVATDITLLDRQERSGDEADQGSEHLRSIAGEGGGRLPARRAAAGGANDDFDDVPF